MTKREEFAAALERLHAAEQEQMQLHDPDHPLTVAFKADVMAEALARRRKGQRHPKDHATACAILDDGVLASIKARHQPAADQIVAELGARREAAKATVDALAAQLTPEPGDLWVELDRVHSGAYRSQGFGAETYAKNAAEMEADMARQYPGIEARVREEFYPEDNQPHPYSAFGGPTHRLGYFVAEAKVRETLDGEIISRGRAPTLREQIKLAWGRGVSPRVFNPYLPHGIEAKLGLDEFGHDLPGWKPDGAKQEG